MDLNRLHKNHLITIDQQEQALAWLIEHGPLVAHPPFSMALLRNLVKRERLLRLRQNLYLAPTSTGRLPSLPLTINLVDPEGYVSGHGALSLHNLNDRDIGQWYSVSTHRQADVSYGPCSIHFVVSPARRKAVATTRVTIQGKRIVVATPARAFVDEVDLMPFSLDYAETARILRYALDTHAVSEDQIVAELTKFSTVAAARRLGFLLELVTGSRNARLIELAQSKRWMTHSSGDHVAEYPWRLYLPQTRASILRASR